LGGNFGSEPYLVFIGNHCEITAGVHFITHDGGTWIFRENKKFLGSKFGPIIIRDNCFIGLNSILLPNITIGPNSVVGAGSVVTKDIPENCVYAGNPAKFICKTDDYLKKCIDNPGDIGIDDYRSLNNKEWILQKLKDKLPLN
jgi:acetyltransferase-like isoleucine patch superfamily enzyme